MLTSRAVPLAGSCHLVHLSTSSQGVVVGWGDTRRSMSPLPTTKSLPPWDGCRHKQDPGLVHGRQEDEHTLGPELAQPVIWGLPGRACSSSSPLDRCWLRRAQAGWAGSRPGSPTLTPQSPLTVRSRLSPRTLLGPAVESGDENQVWHFLHEERQMWI